VGVTAGDISAGADTTLEFAFNSPLFHEGDTLERLLVYYWFQTRYVDNSSLTGVPSSICVAAWWQPNPQADAAIEDPTSETITDALTGDALYVDYGRWRSDRWTDGTLHATQWICDSGGPVSVQGRRTIIDQPSTLLTLGWDLHNVSSGGSSDLSPTIDGYIALRYLVDVKQAP
jgi:hypothetical protein